ncbi:hypothetical protein KAR48_18120 [bacterium]|nr:hypothetical protein [bacterium]
MKYWLVIIFLHSFLINVFGQESRALLIGGADILLAYDDCNGGIYYADADEHEIVPTQLFVGLEFPFKCSNINFYYKNYWSQHNVRYEWWHSSDDAKEKLITCLNSLSIGFNHKINRYLYITPQMGFGVKIEMMHYGKRDFEIFSVNYLLETSIRISMFEDNSLGFIVSLFSQNVFENTPDTDYTLCLGCYLGI